MKIFQVVVVTAALATAAFAGDGSIIRKGKPVANQYIVTFSSDLRGAPAASFARQLAAQHGGKVRKAWEDHRPSASMTLSESAAQAISRHPNVLRVEEDAMVELAGVQSSAPWHLDRIDDRTLAEMEGTYDTCTGATNVRAYVVDTGVLGSHEEFRVNTLGTLSRVEAGYEAATLGANGVANNPCPDPPSDCYNWDPYCLIGGHGTAVASVLGGLTYGAAKSVTIVPVRITNCMRMGTESDALDGLSWILQDYPTHNQPAVVNMSFGYEISPSAPQTLFETRVNDLIAANITVVAAAGNQNRDANTISPARMARQGGGQVITVAGTSATDRRWICGQEANDLCSSGDGSNHTTVDIFAPARNVRSAGIVTGINNGFIPSNSVERAELLSGTSFAAPLVAARVARFVAGATPSAYTPAYIWSFISGEATQNVLQSHWNAPLYGPNLLIFQPRGVSRYCGF